MQIGGLSIIYGHGSVTGGRGGGSGHSGGCSKVGGYLTGSRCGEGGCNSNSGTRHVGGDGAIITRPGPVAVITAITLICSEGVTVIVVMVPTVVAG
jgi:hypothetical protein